MTRSPRQPMETPPAFRLRDKSRRGYKELKRDQEFVRLGNISLSAEEMTNGHVIGVASHPDVPVLL